MYICNCIWIYHSSLHKKTCRCYNNPLNVKFRNRKLQNKHVLKTHSTVRHGVPVHNPWPNLKPCRLRCSDITANTCRRPRFIREPWSAPRSQEECSIVAICWKNKRRHWRQPQASPSQRYCLPHTDSFVYYCGITPTIIQQHPVSFQQHLEHIHQMHFVTSHKQDKHEAYCPCN